MVLKRSGTCKSNILIIGGGIAGLTLAAILGSTGLSVHIVDPSAPAPLKKTPPSGRTVALMQSSVNILTATDVWDSCRNFATPMRHMKIMDDSIGGAKPVSIDFDSHDIGLEQFGFNIPNDPLRAALFETVKAHRNITVHVPDALESYDTGPAHITARLKSGKVIETKLLIGADGRNSKVRELSGIPTWNKKYRQSAITCIINHSRSHNNTAHEFHRPGGPLALVPLQGNQCSVVWVEPEEKAQEIMTLPAGDFIARLHELTNDVLGGITLEKPPQSWPLSSLRAKSLTAPRMALMAEAAHAMSPITAQGLNLSLRDVAALAESIADALRLGLDIGSANVLENYEHRRSIDIRTRIMGVDGMNTLVSSGIGGVKGLRRTALKTVDSLPFLKTFAMQQGLAPPIDKGRLAQGLPL